MIRNTLIASAVLAASATASAGPVLACGSTEEAMVEYTRTSAIEHVDTAIADMSAVPAGRMGQSPRWNYWFGQERAESRGEELLRSLRLMRSGLDTVAVTCDCSLGPGYYGYAPYVGPNAGMIELCPDFFVQPLLGVTGRMSTLVHEVSHLRDGARADDHAFGVDASASLAIQSPDTAITNADSIAFFVTNLPELPMYQAPTETYPDPEPLADDPRLEETQAAPAEDTNERQPRPEPSSASSPTPPADSRPPQESERHPETESVTPEGRDENHESQTPETSPPVSEPSSPQSQPQEETASTPEQFPPATSTDPDREDRREERREQNTQHSPSSQVNGLPETESQEPAYSQHSPISEESPVPSQQAPAEESVGNSSQPALPSAESAPLQARPSTSSSSAGSTTWLFILILIVARACRAKG